MDGSDRGSGALAADARVRRRATAVTVLIAGVLAASKLAVAFASGSVGVLSSLADSLGDVAASLLTAWSVRIAHLPADEEHRYGHGRIEALSSLVQAALLAASAVFVVYLGVERLLHPEPLRHAPWALAVMGLSVAGSVAILGIQRAALARVRSLAIEADSAHYRGDVLANLAVVVALLVAGRPGWGWVDPVAGAAIALYLLAASLAILRRSADQLMDRELPEEERARISAIIDADPDVRGHHDLRTRSLGISAHIELHLELDGHLDLERAHDITDRVEDAIRAGFPGSEITIHTEPHGLDDQRLDDLVRGQGPEAAP